MEADKGLDLTLSLPCGGPSAGVKGKNSSGSEVRVEEADRGSKLIDDFKNFLDGANHKDVDASSTVGSQRNNQSKPEENLFYDLSKGTANVDASSNINSGGFWGKNEGRSTELLEDKRQEAGSKRKTMFDEINHQKRHERETYIARTPHDEGSTAENEDVADSEAEGSTSKRQTGSVGLSEGTKEAHGVSDSNGVDLQVQRRFTISSEKEFKIGHVSRGLLFSGQPANILSMPYPSSVKESNSNPLSENVAPGYALPGTIPAMATATTVRPANLPLMFGYSPVQVPTGETVNSAKPFERAKIDGKHGKEEGSSMHSEGEMKGTTVIDQAKAEGIPLEYPAIRPGIAAELKFGGSGSSPNLPWVSTTGTGPNGKTISGVTYRYSGTQIRIVCACHGSHMSPEEFIQHASEEQVNPNGGGSGLPSFPNSNPAASAQN